MKKILGISLVAVLAAMPTLANAARTVEKATIITPNTAANSPLATASYVKGAFNANAGKINDLIDDTAVTGTHNYIVAGNSVSENLNLLDSGLNTAQTTASSAWSAIQNAQTGLAAAHNAASAAQESADSALEAIAAIQSGEGSMGARLTAVEGVASGAVSAASAAQTTASSAWDAIQNTTTGLAAAHNAATAASNAAATAQAAAEAAQTTADSAWNAIDNEGGISDRLSAVETAASDAADAAATAQAAAEAAQTTASSAWNAIQNETTGLATKASQTALSNEIERATGAESALSGRIKAIEDVAGDYATQAGVLATLNSATISVVSDWATDTPTNAALITPNGYKTGE